MFDKILNRFEKLDMEKLVEVVNLVWNNREKIVVLLENLPTMLRETGASIESAGESAVQASRLLTGDDDMPSAGELSRLAANALERCERELAAASKIMGSLGQEIDDVRIPSVRPKYIEVLGAQVVGGLEFGESPLVNNTAARLKSGAGRLEEIGRDLRQVATQLNRLGGALTETGGSLNNVGVQLKQSGVTLRSLGDFKKK